MDGAADASGGGAGTSFVAERFDDVGNPCGRFDAHWESEDGSSWRQGPEGVSANDAVAWARGHADLVVVFMGDGVTYSAGTQTVPDFPRPWPAGGLTVEPRQLSSHWNVRILVPAPEEGGAFPATRLRDLLASSPVVTAARLTTGDRVGLECVIEAATASAALFLVDELLPPQLYDGTSLAGGTSIEVVGPA
jgi:hypothetical protein